MRAAVCVVLALAWAGCLSDPEPAGAIDSGPSGDDAGGVPGDDAGAPLGCPAPGLPAFPPVELTEFRSPQVARINGDALDDLVLVDPQTATVHILLGRTCEFGTVSDAVHSVAGFVALGVALAELGGGDGFLDLAVIGTDGVGRLSVFKGTGALSFDATALTRVLPTAPMASELVFVAPMDRDGDDRVDLVFGHDSALYTAELPAGVLDPPDPGAFSTMPTTPLPVPPELPGGQWGGRPIAHPFPSPTGAGVDDFLVSLDPLVFWYHNDGAGGFTYAPFDTTDKNVHAVFADILGGDGVPEIIGAQDAVVGVTRIHPEADATSYRLVLASIGTATGVAVANFDDDPRPEIVATDGTYVALYTNVTFLDDDTNPLVIPTTGPHEITLPGDFRADFLITGNFRGDATPELLVLDSARGLRCYIGDTIFTPCP